MGILDKLKQKLIDIIEWKVDSTDIMVWRFLCYQDEIKYRNELAPLGF